MVEIDTTEPDTTANDATANATTESSKPATLVEDFPPLSED